MNRGALQATVQKVKYKLFGHVQPFLTTWTVACQASLSMKFSRQNIGVGSHSLLMGIFPDQGSNLGLQDCGPILHCLSHMGSYSLWGHRSVGHDLATKQQQQSLEYTNLSQ